MSGMWGDGEKTSIKYPQVSRRVNLYTTLVDPVAPTFPIRSLRGVVRKTAR